jgi:hypothetical protein
MTGARPKRPVRPNGVLQIRGFLGIFKNPGAGKSHPRPTVCFGAQSPWASPTRVDGQSAGRFQAPDAFILTGARPKRPVRPNGVLQIRGFLGFFKNPRAGKSHPRQTVFRCLESLGEPNGSGGPVCGSVSGPEAFRTTGVPPVHSRYDLTMCCKSADSWEFSKIQGLENHTRGRPCFGA